MHQTPKPALSFVNAPSPWDMYCRFWCAKGPGPCAGGCRPLQKMEGPCMAQRPQPALESRKRRQAPEKEMQTRARQIWYVACRSARHMCRTGGNEWRNEAKTIHGSRRFKCVFWLYFFVFPLTARFFRPIMLIMYHHGLVCPCAKNMPKIFVHFDDFCPGRKAALRGVTKKRNMLKK